MRRELERWGQGFPRETPEAFGDWEVGTLCQEQRLVQSLYRGLSESDLQNLYDIAELGLVALIGGTFTLQLLVPKGTSEISPSTYFGE